ncbi:Ig kappa chain V-I region Walker [Oryzias melastigma]|uniref:Ig kappa chain V-I region Walker n=1 Tax=Oryzias melastigma TaxID=30732 RepID=A0A834C8L3_ORYME|nr:Ig kappa chain V-I region Walker [Oryzias melastigma]
MMAPLLLASVLRGNSFIPFSAAILLLADVCLGVEITQTPSEVLKKPGDEVQLVCSHGKTDYTYMQWYQNPPGDPALKRIGHLNYGTPELETAFKNRFRISGDLSGEKAKNASVFIQRLQVEDSGVFYCAASFARQQQTHRPSYKNSSPAHV